MKLENNIIEKIIDILKKLNINIDNPTSNFIEGNNVDSITFIQIIIDIEVEFSILIPDEYLLMEGFNTVSEIANIVEKLINIA